MGFGRYCRMEISRMSCAPAVGLALLCIMQPPFQANPDQGGRPSIGQRVHKDWRPVPGMSASFDCAGPCVVRISGHVGFQITQYASKDCRHEDRYLVELRVTVNGAQVSGSTGNTNVARWQHYFDHDFYIVEPLESGSYRVAVEARQHRKDDGDCRVYVKERQYSRMQVEVQD